MRQSTSLSQWSTSTESGCVVYKVHTGCCWPHVSNFRLYKWFHQGTSEPFWHVTLYSQAVPTHSPLTHVVYVSQLWAVQPVSDGSFTAKQGFGKELDCNRCSSYVLLTPRLELQLPRSVVSCWQFFFWECFKCGPTKIRNQQKWFALGKDIFQVISMQMTAKPDLKLLKKKERRVMHPASTEECREATRDATQSGRTSSEVNHPS